MKEIIVKMESNGQLFPVRELIRCKDCANYNSLMETCINGDYCNPDFFCGDAEPKGGEQK